MIHPHGHFSIKYQHQQQYTFHILLLPFASPVNFHVDTVTHLPFNLAGTIKVVVAFQSSELWYK